MFVQAYNTFRSHGVPLQFELFNAKLNSLQRGVFSLMGLLIIFTGIALILSSMDDLTDSKKIWFISIGYAFLAGGIAFVVNAFVRRRTVVGKIEILETGIQVNLEQDSSFIPYFDIKKIIFCDGMLNNYFNPTNTSDQQKRSNIYSQIFVIELTNGSAYLIESSVTISRRLLYIIHIPIVQLSKVFELAIGNNKIKKDKKFVKRVMKKHPMNKLINLESYSNK